MFIHFTGAQFGTIISMPLSGLLSAYGFDGGWPSIFYVFGLVGVVWSVAFLIFVYEDPSTHPNIDEKERKYINSALWGATNVTVSSIYFSCSFSYLTNVTIHSYYCCLSYNGNSNTKSIVQRYRFSRGTLYIFHLNSNYE